MGYLKQIAILLWIGASAYPAVAQEQKRALAWEDVVSWKRITGQALSDDGKWAACRMEPWRGDAAVEVFDEKGKRTASFRPAGEIGFSPSSTYLLVTELPPLEEVEALKLAKTKEEMMPMNRLIIHRLATKSSEYIDSLKSYKRAPKADLIAYQRGGKADSTLYVRALGDTATTAFPRVTEFQFAKESNLLYYVSKGDSAQQAVAGLYVYSPEKGDTQPVYEGDGTFGKTAFDKAGDKLAFLYCPDKDSTDTGFSLFVSTGRNPAKEVAGRGHPSFPENWVISGHGELRFSTPSERLFFGIAPEPKQKDTTCLAENRPDVQVWKWDEEVQYTQQLYNREKDLKKSYATVYHFNAQTILPLATPDLPELETADEGCAGEGMLTTPRPYERERMWIGHERFDAYAVDIETGKRELVKEALLGRVRLSPKGRYAYWYCLEDSAWHTYSMERKREYRLTTPARFTAWDEKNDMPDYPESYGIAGWTTGDAHLLIYDRYDIWQFDPEAASPPVNLTVNGRASRIVYRLIQLDREQKSIDPAAAQLLSGFHEASKGSGFYRVSLSSPPAVPETLLEGKFMLKTPVKAKEADVVVYTAETFDQYPDLRRSGLTFKRPVQLTEGGKQQKGFIWGNAELVSWTSLDGKPLEGVVYKPDNFDPNRKYPLIVNFYERNAEALYSYRMPEPHRSTIDYHFYTSNGYIVFNPDIHYKTGYPGEDCFNCVMPGITALLSKGYIDEKAIAAQGHSWGGYQVAYLATRTDIFAAIESGAPVVNMFSAYGGIRWGSGLNRSFQYEHTQSRIGATIWETPLRYIENSPLFTMDKVQTPILILHNDNDGHVPWYQGIEYFIALKRLQKPVWLLNYPGEVHWPMRMANRIDFQRRMFQFFEHYLRARPMPAWMSKGIPAVDKDFDLGYGSAF
ncbi:MAG: prolyl oligopeptidase family serine peptidase [Tannerellaceae bacterium]|jgi:dipeptidyl aminopeptidase/acylaminoacyl peptidase|nr:prolyl oligopeptidase family serine peptidase [Tannerellaceae bacterium]